MDDSTPLPATPEAVMLLDPATVLAAVSNPVRYALLRRLATVGAASVNDLAAEVDCAADSISKHLRVLREARVLRVIDAPDGDGRKAHHEIPALFRSRDAAGKPIADFGAVVLRFG